MDALPSYDFIFEKLQKQKDKYYFTATGYLSKKKPQHKILEESIFHRMAFL